MNLKALFPIKALNCGITEAYSISGKLVESPHSLLLRVLGRHLGRCPMPGSAHPVLALEESGLYSVQSVIIHKWPHRTAKSEREPRYDQLSSMLRRDCFHL